MSANNLRACIFLFFCSLLFLLPGLSTIPPLDREEARFAQASRQMVETGDLIDVRFQTETLSAENLIVYWAQAAAVKTAAALGLPRAPLRVWLYRVPSQIGAIAAILMAYWAALAFLDRRAALLAAAMVMASLVLGMVARLASPAAIMLAISLAAMGAMARAYLIWARGDVVLHPPWRLVMVFWGAIAGGLIVDGITSLMVIALTMIVLALLDRSLGWVQILQPVWGISLVILAVGAWAIIIFAMGGDGTTVQQALGSPVFDRLSRIAMFQGGPPGLQLVMFWVTFWPAATLAGLALPAIWLARREPEAQFLLAWIIPSWLVIELFFPKMPHYVLPLLPAIAIIISGAIERGMLSEAPWLQRGPMWWFVVPALLSVAAVVSSIALTRQPAFIVWPFAAGAMIFALVAWLLYDPDRAERSMLNAMVSSLLLAIAIYGALMPLLVPVFPSVQLSRIWRNSPCDHPVAASAGFHEPSLIFMTSTTTQLLDASGAADFMAQGPCRYAFVEAKQERAFAQRAEAIGLRYAMVSRVDGFNYSKGRRISVAVFRSEDP